eukprot:507861-Lingulodinium_polyedra.AAC.1
MPPMDSRGYEAIRPGPEAPFRLIYSDETGGYLRWFLLDGRGIVWTVVVLAARSQASGLQLLRLVPTEP